MPSLKYFLKSPESKTESLVYLIFQYGYYEIDQKSGRKKYKFLKMSTGEKVAPKLWNQTKCRIRETRSFPQSSEYNTRLENLENLVFNIYRKLINDGKFPTPSKLRHEVLLELDEQKLQENGNPEQVGFFDFIQLLIDDSKNGIRLTANGKHFASYTVEGYNTTRKHLETFQKYRCERIEFDSIDMDFYNSLVNWFYDQNKAKNTVGKHIKNLKVFMSEAFDRGITKNVVFKRKKFKVLEEETDTIYITDDEIELMLALDLSTKPGLDLTRDCFILDCYIGLRIADFNNLKKDHIVEIQGIKMIKILMQKTGYPVMIPLNKNAIRILEKYDYEIKTNTDQTMNRKIKVVGKMAGIEDNITTTITKGGKRESKVYKKYEKITNHTARRSFATNLYLANVPVLAIMKMTGHKTEKSFLKYIRVTPEENALKIAQHPYFAR